MTLFFCNSGPLIKYNSDCLYIEDLNPEQKMRWRVTKWELIVMGFKFIIAGIRP